ncbi:MAG: beta/gamma crystallin-related protein [Planctomycetota bacterium]
MRRAILVLGAAIGVGVVVVCAFPRREARVVRARSGAAIVLYTGEGFQGRSVTLEGTAFDLPAYPDADGSEFNWNDRVRSLVVLGGTWRLYQHGRLNTRLDDTPLEEFRVGSKLPDEGWSTLLSATSAGPLKVADVREFGIGSDISSAELISEENLPDWALGLRKP